MSQAKGLKKTPLYDLYQDNGAKVIDFGGWALPVQFSSIIEEHHAVRTKAGLFDVSHMGEIVIEGDDAESFVNYLITNDVTKIDVNQAQYTAMCYENGGTVDDLLVYKLAAQTYLFVVNAANIEKDVEWIKLHATDNVTVKNISDQLAQLAIQGPQAAQILQNFTSVDVHQIKPFRFEQHVEIAGINDVLISRTGYTGEDGFELYLANEDAPKLWKELLEADGELVPCGLGARDTLRFEATLALYGQELTSTITPIEAGIRFTVKPDKPDDFIGKAVLTKEKEAGPKRQLVGLAMTDRGIPRHGYEVYSTDGELIGCITSGTHSPSCQKQLGLAIVEKQYAEIDTPLQVKIRNKLIDAVIVPTPFYHGA
ncbi:glycine cleavage system aminomethyltransferase GcvT [Gracilibacillus sp. S3-1-1]|uniref:Glycine cleavage system aminomethyltransferase GcvT n=1 Tax=Gracilibacillus pellucidus TaxID=3095368 RepID=A0ACC6M063_9BACI|nr:glycine cleavage system aminomethyltransferase GcvT [Gracilibacillus sp. S3-1-1]MDX8044358.1 glycine cleavage system aminomethyltransferase GcvT [Gracilibacillus sp. S3-1-1]